MLCVHVFCFFKQKTAYEMRIRDWSSDVCSSDLGVPFEKTAYQINQLCGSGLRAVALGYQAIRNGDSAIVVAGGQESMSQAPHCMHLRSGVKMGNAEMIDTMIKDGLWDAFNGYHMGNTAEDRKSTRLNSSH